MGAQMNTPAEAFPPGEYLHDEIEARGWTITQFAEIVGRPTQAMSEIINGKKELTVQTAMQIAVATGTEATTWLAMQDAYRLWQETHTSTADLDKIERRARLASLVDIRELKKRGIVPGKDLDAQESAVRDLLGYSDLTQQPAFVAAARRANTVDEWTPTQISWVACARAAAAASPTRTFNITKSEDLGERLIRILTEPQRAAALPDQFTQAGVRLVYIPKFPSGKIDGASWCDSAGPVIAVACRYDRLDNLVFTVLHELAHVVQGHVDLHVILDDLSDTRTFQIEDEANHLAGLWATPASTVGPPYSRQRILDAATVAGVHPAIIVGRLHHEGRLGYNQLRRLLVPVETHLANWPTYPAAVN